MAWGESTLGTSSPSWKWPKGLLSPFGFERLGLGTAAKALGPLSAPFSIYESGRTAEEMPGMMSINPLALPSFLIKNQFDKLMGWNQGRMPTDYPKHASGNIKAFQESMKDSIKKADSEDDEEDDPFNYNQLFLASILKGLKEKQPKTASGKPAGTYIPRPDLPKMSDYDSNKTYWNIG